MGSRNKLLRVRHIPSAITLANLICGFLSILCTIEGQINWGAGFILLSVLLDGLDGKMARKLSICSDFGKELDSLSDLVSFGVAPAILAYVSLIQIELGYGGILIAVVFVLCGAVRLARFNTLDITTYFLGVPITFAGGFVALLMLLHPHLPWYIIAACMMILSILMVSTIKVPKLGK